MVTSSKSKPDEEKIKAISEIPAPTNKKGVERLFGTANYLSKFIPNLATVTEPIKTLLRKVTEYQYGLLCKTKLS